MKALFLFLTIFIVGCTTPITHVGADLITFESCHNCTNNMCFSPCEKHYATYRIGSLLDYPEIKAHENIPFPRDREQNVQCISAEDSNPHSYGNINAVHYAIVYATDQDVLFAYPTRYQCTFDLSTIKSYVFAVNKQRNDEVRNIEEKKKAIFAYKKTKEYAYEIMNRVGFRRAIAINCLEYQLSNGEAYLAADRDAIDFAKKAAGKYYQEDYMLKAMNMGLSSIKEQGFGLPFYGICADINNGLKMH